MFEKAAKLKLRFPSSIGAITTEDLFDLPLQHTKAASLDAVAIELSRQIKALGEESFVSAKPVANSVLQLKLDIVKHIIALKIAEDEARTKAADNKALKDKITSIIAQKQDEELLGKSVEELQALIK